MKQKPIEITGLFLRNSGDYIIVELEIDGQWYKILEDKIGPMEGVVSHIVEPLGILRAIEDRKPL